MTKEEMQELLKQNQAETIALMEAYFDPKFNLLLDKMNLITDKSQDHEERISRVEILNGIFH
jgi:hypothetical protein